jgi:hypothetical protein
MSTSEEAEAAPILQAEDGCNPPEVARGGTRPSFRAAAAPAATECLSQPIAERVGGTVNPDRPKFTVLPLSALPRKALCQWPDFPKMQSPCRKSSGINAMTLNPAGGPKNQVVRAMEQSPTTPLSGRARSCRRRRPRSTKNRPSPLKRRRDQELRAVLPLVSANRFPTKQIQRLFRPDIGFGGLTCRLR